MCCHHYSRYNYNFCKPDEEELCWWSIRVGNCCGWSWGWGWGWGASPYITIEQCLLQLQLCIFFLFRIFDFPQTLQPDLSRTILLHQAYFLVVVCIFQQFSLLQYLFLDHVASSSPVWVYSQEFRVVVW